MPKNVNLSCKYISDVTYTSKKLDEMTTAAFLKFKLFIRRKSTEYNSKRHFLIAYSEPYTYSRLHFLLE